MMRFVLEEESLLTSRADSDSEGYDSVIDAFINSIYDLKSCLDA